MSSSSGAPPPLTRTEWLICFVAALGFAFDIYELLMLPLIARPAMLELLGVPPGSPALIAWRGWLFWVPALAGGAFGLLGGYLTDLFGRRRVLVWSILLYAFSALAAGFATSAEMLLFFRCTTFVGVSVEFVAAVAWLAELFPDPRRREAVLGWTQAFSSVGGLMVTGAYYLAVHYADSLPEIRGGHRPWRYALVSGVIPALPLILIRPFLPESPAWREKKLAGTLKRPSLGGDLPGRAARAPRIVTTLMFACSYGAAFGAIQQMPGIVPGLAEVATLARPAQEKIVSSVQAFQEVGGLVGRVLLALLGGVRRLAPQAAARLPGARPGRVAARLRARGELERVGGPVGHFPVRPPDRGAVQLLGELPAARLSDAPSWDGRGLRSERRRPDDRHVRRVGDHLARGAHAGLAGTEARRGGRARRPRRVRVGFAASFFLPEPQAGGAARLRRPGRRQCRLSCCITAS